MTVPAANQGPDLLLFTAVDGDYCPFGQGSVCGLMLLLGSGLGMLAIYGFAALGWTWLKWKLVLVVCVIVPIEIGDIWFGHFRLPRWFRSPQRDSDLQHSGNELERYENRFVPLTLPILLIAVVVILWLAVARPM